MSGASIVIIMGGTGPRLNTDYGTPYTVSAGDVVSNEAPGAVELHFTGAVSGFQVIPLSGYSGYEFTEAGSFIVYQ